MKFTRTYLSQMATEQYWLLTGRVESILARYENPCGVCSKTGCHGLRDRIHPMITTTQLCCVGCKHFDENNNRCGTDCLACKLFFCQSVKNPQLKAELYDVTIAAMSQGLLHARTSREEAIKRSVSTMLKLYGELEF